MSRCKLRKLLFIKYTFEEKNNDFVSFEILNNILFFSNLFFSIKEKDVILQNLQTTESQLKSQLSELENGLETQRGKNNVSIKL